MKNIRRSVLGVAAIVTGCSHFHPILDDASRSRLRAEDRFVAGNRAAIYARIEASGETGVLVPIPSDLAEQATIIPARSPVEAVLHASNDSLKQIRESNNCQFIYAKQIISRPASFRCAELSEAAAEIRSLEVRIAATAQELRQQILDDTGKLREELKGVAALLGPTVDPADSGSRQTKTIEEQMRTLTEATTRLSEAQTRADGLQRESIQSTTKSLLELRRLVAELRKRIDTAD